MSFVVLVMRLATEKSCISSLPMSITWRQPSIFAPTDRISAVAPDVLMSVVRSVM